MDDGEPADTDTVRDFCFHSSMAPAATCCRFLQCAFLLKTHISSCKLTAGNDSFILYSYQNNIKQFATTKSVLQRQICLPTPTHMFVAAKTLFQAQCKLNDTSCEFDATGSLLRLQMLRLQILATLGSLLSCFCCCKTTLHFCRCNSEFPPANLNNNNGNL